MIDVSIPPELEAKRQRVTAFVEQRNFDQLVLELVREALELAEPGIPKGESGETKSGGEPTFLTTS